MKLCYLAGPYSASTTWAISLHIQQARMVAMELRRLGWAVYSPHANSAHCDGGIWPSSREADQRAWLREGLTILSRLKPGHDVLVTLPNYEQSDGTLGEMAQAVNQGVAVYHWPEDRDTLRTLARPVVMPEPPDGPDD